MSDLTTPAPAGQVWVCGACGKKSRTKSGYADDWKTRTNIDHGWDESCMLNSFLCYEQRLADGTYQVVTENEHA